MNIIRHTLIGAIACATFASADTLSPLRQYSYFDAVKAVGDSTFKKIINKEDLSEEEYKKVNQIISEAEPLFNLSLDSLAELSALGGPESKVTAISAVVLQETIIDYELLTVGKKVPTLITYYISQSKTAKLQPIQRVVCYVLIKSSMRKIQAAKANE
jgi:hypothetical protein